MDFNWIEEYCLSKNGTAKDYKEEWDAVRFQIGDKMYAMLGEMKGEPIFTLKLPPEYGETLRRIYSGIIIPGYYMNKVHWNSIKADGNVPDALLREMLEKSYRLVLGGFSKSSYDTVLKSLPKKKQKEIEEM